jgi:hypothetical protein
LSNQVLKKPLALDGCFEMPHAPGLWQHICHPVWFKLVVDDFGIKYTGSEAERLLQLWKNILK